MRIIAGSAKGRVLAAPKHGTRPMTGRARESMFSILAHRLAGADVLDLFAGSGSLGLEALSRGAASATFVERSRGAAKMIQKNIESVDRGGTVVVGDVLTVLPRLRAEFDLIFVDPPYALPDNEVHTVLAAIDGAMTETGMVVLHRQSRSDVAVPEFLTCVDERRYGDAVITMMERVDR